MVLKNVVLIALLLLVSTHQQNVGANLRRDNQEDDNKARSRSLRDRRVQSGIPRHKKPNVLFIALDDFVWLDTPHGNHGALHTPGFDALAADSLTLENAHVQHPICTASRGSILLGRRPDTTRLFDFSVSMYANGGSCSSCLTVPELFRAEGYKTINVGKVFHAWFDRQGGHPRAWDQVKAYCSDNHDLTHQIANGDIIPCDKKILKHAQDALIERSKYSKPWFMGVGFISTHLPWVSPEEYYRMHPLENVQLPSNYDLCTENSIPVALRQDAEFEKYPDMQGIEVPCGKESSKEMNHTLARELTQAYRASVSYLDSLVGVLVKDLKTLGMWDDTIIMLWSDHGYKLGEHHLWHKNTLHRESTKCPIMLRVPGLTDGGKVSHALVEHVDIMATLVEAAGLQPLPLCPNVREGGEPWKMERCTEGHSFLSLANSDDEFYRETFKDAAFSQVFKHQGSDGAVMGYSITTANGLRFSAWVNFAMDVSPMEWATNDWVIAPNIGGFELYNHTVDPSENVNISPFHTSLVEHLYEKLRDGWRGVINGTVLEPHEPQLPWLCNQDEGCWPQTWILGGQKCGSTSLEKLLETHFSTCGALLTPGYRDWLKQGGGGSYASPKETHVLQSKFATSRNITALYPSAHQSSCANGFVEATPHNSFDYEAPAKLATFLHSQHVQSALRFVMVVREPIAREISSFHHQKRDGYSWGKRSNFPRCDAQQHQTYETYAACELSTYYMVLKSLNASASEVPSAAFGSVVHEELSRKSDLYVGMYTLQLEHWFRYFPRSQVLVVAMDTLLQNTTEFIPRLTQFLRFEGKFENFELPHANANSNSTPPISCATRDALAEVFGPINSRLYSVLKLPEVFGSGRPAEESAFPPFSPVQCEE
jgi:iduronate 2-sulfatase